MTFYRIRFKSAPHLWVGNKNLTWAIVPDTCIENARAYPPHLGKTRTDELLNMHSRFSKESSARVWTDEKKLRSSLNKCHSLDGNLDTWSEYEVVITKGKCTLIKPLDYFM